MKRSIVWDFRIEKPCQPLPPLESGDYIVHCWCYGKDYKKNECECGCYGVPEFYRKAERMRKQLDQERATYFANTTT